MFCSGMATVFGTSLFTVTKTMTRMRFTSFFNPLAASVIQSFINLARHTQKGTHTHKLLHALQPQSVITLFWFFITFLTFHREVSDSRIRVDVQIKTRKDGTLLDVLCVWVLCSCTHLVMIVTENGCMCQQLKCYSACWNPSIHVHVSARLCLTCNRQKGLCILK